MRLTSAFGSAVAIALLASALASGPVAAAGTLTVEPPSGVPGQTLTAKGSHSYGKQSVTLRWDGTKLLESGSSGEDGSFEIAFKIPAGAAVGGHELRACVRGDCTFAPPFTVAVVLAPPSSNPTVAPTPPPSSPSTPAPVTPTPSPVSSPPPAGSSTPGASASASPAASVSASSGLIDPTVAPTALPADPDAPGTVKLQFHWDRVLVAGLLGLSVLLLFYAWATNDNRLLRSRSGHAIEGTSNEKWLRSTSGTSFLRRTFQIFTAGKDAPGKTPKLYEASTKGTHAPPNEPETPPDLVTHEATHADAAEPPRKSGSLVMYDAEQAPGTGAETDVAAATDPDAASKVVKLKGKNIGEN